MKKVVHKKTIIRALRTESLMQGMFFRASDPWGDCEVCAVGSILRKIGIQEDHIEDVGYWLTDGICGPDQSSVKLLLSGGLWWSALSVYFESLSTISGVRKPTKRQREQLVRFVEKHFPAKITLDLPQQWSEVRK